MKESKALYGFYDYDECIGLVWETELGKIVTLEGKLNLNNNLVIRDVETGKDIDDIDLRNVLISILPQKLVIK